MPNYKLTYFALEGKGECIRLLLAYGEMKFEDVRIDYKDFPAIKPTLPLGQFPIFEVDGKLMYQSVAICRYLGRLNNLYGDNAWEAAQIDIIVDSVYEIRNKLITVHHESNTEIKEKQFAELNKTAIPLYFNRFEEIATENGGYLANKKLSWADIYFYSLIDGLEQFARVKVAEKYPNLGKVVQNCYSIPQIKKYVDNRK